MKHTLLLTLAALLSLSACSEKSGPGQLSVTIAADPGAAAAADAPALEGVDEAWVHVTRVRAHSEEGGWTDLSTTPVDVNLLAINDVDLGFANLPAGTVTQIRLVVDPEGDNYLVLTGGTEVPLIVPSGSQSGIKIVGPWEIDSCEETSVTLHGPGLMAHGTGSGDEWILRPTILHTTVEQGPGTCEPAATCVPAQCPSGFCNEVGDACAPGGFDAPCTVGSECLSNVCSEGTCAPGAETSPCREPADCGTGLTCTNQVCTPAAT